MTPDTVSARSSFFRPTWAEIDVEAFIANARALAGLLSGARMIVVLKADGYGHGAAALARAAASAGLPMWGFGVSSVEEGVALREAGLTQPILILGSLFPFESFEPALEHRLTPTVASAAVALELEKVAARIGRRSAVHLKVDTGMGRIGVSPKGAGEVVDAIKSCGRLALEAVYTHLAKSDSADDTRMQLARFDGVLKDVRARGLSPHAHAANSTALIHFPESHYNFVRPGLALYGVPPTPESARSVSLKPVLAWKTRVVFLKSVPSGTPVSYDGTHRVSRPSRLATLPVGYADGYRRALSNKGCVLVKGRRCPVLGRVTMDQTVVDVTDVPQVDVGAEAVLLGAQGAERITANEMASWADTISYEVLCGITNRVPRMFRRAEGGA
jgi:alanine racemase